ncbi:S-methyl-5'-thioinosine phosphorylase [Chitinimonas sp. BJB300]|uniref:S-methyl-5'-thioinosine phosphorylase n=1 Tax=Chitinimonas sp. BJB300 TaxID=1559339 RepID=UPI000C0E3721|nr:S-methyl-5'-thioinosine phosphorylase [Chitinimonas sp. BJB300]PHV12490.1 5'-methylthioadenosine phosphorylase [Chitinimonas sp. BJB300]TSJ89121.1 S-methyl-5'-thioinosine phosphorylase [Chitinimonas sp. BJB300]
MLAIIGGTGLTRLKNLKITHRQVIRTPYGEPSGALTFGEINDHHVVFIARHGYGHTIPPHEINYRANIWALAEQQVSRIVSVCTVGGIREDLAPGMLVLPDQLIDYTYGRRHTFFEGGDKPVTHSDFTEPYCPKLRRRILQAAKTSRQTLIESGVYAATQGPRLETAAEINRIARDGGDMVGMTGMPEAALARESGLSYAAIAVVSNWAAGRGNSLHKVDLAAAETIFQAAIEHVHRMLEALVKVEGV